MHSWKRVAAHVGPSFKLFVAVTLLAAACRVVDQGVPNAEITRLTITPDSVPVVAGQTIQFHALGSTADGASRPVTVQWRASGGTIDANGLYTADSTPGNFDVTATLGASLSATAKVKNHGALKQVALDPDSVSLGTGGTVQFSAFAVAANGDSSPVDASYSATGGTITASGMYTAGTSNGDFVVIATVSMAHGGSRSDTAHVTITGGTAAAVASVTVSPPTASVAVGATVQLTATTRDANGNVLTGRAITWASDAAGVAAVDGTGLVTGVSSGSATITATSEGKSGTASVTVTSGSGGTVVFVGAGDISDCGNNDDEATATLLDGIAGTVFTLGDNVYSDGTLTQFQQCYDPTWGRHKARTAPAPGNHDYNTNNAAGYFGYFGALAGPSGRGYYSFDLGNWHIISLDSEIDMSAGSAQETWLRADLAASTRTCTVAYWHKPRFSSGTNHGSDVEAQPLWQALYDFHAELVLNGHEHNYERFAPQTPTGVADPANGIREIISGTGGESHYNDEGTPLPNSQVFNGTTFGVLKLTLGAGTYSWQFIPVAGQTFTDSGNGSCH